MTSRLFSLPLMFTLLGTATSRIAADEYDIVVYGGTSAAVTTAVQTRRLGKTTIIVCPDKHLGGLTSGGLGWTDTGNKAVIGGLAREFYHRIWQKYQQPDTWRWQSAEQYGNKGQGTAAIDGDQRTMWIFEPHVAEQVCQDFIDEFQIPVHRDEWLDRQHGVERDGDRITRITMLSGKSYTGRMFVDATYEGDLLAAAGVDYHVGREARAQYNEEWNGVQTGVLHHAHHFGVLEHGIRPWRIADDPSSGLLPRISDDPPGEYGAADTRIQAYCFRMCLTNHDENRVPFRKPANYDPAQYELLARIYDAGWRATFGKFDPIPNHKTDTNNHGPMSTDNIGYNYDYPEGSYDRRREIIREHETYQQGWLYFIANDLRVPVDVREAMSQWGLARDEFVDNNYWPHQIYVREARRLIGKFVMTENELLKRRPTPDSVGMGSYGMDSHNVQRYVTPDGFVQNEGDIGVSTQGAYRIAYGSLVPKRGQCANLLVPVCVSSSHIAFGSIRMEPVFMILGHSAATAAAMAIDHNVTVQDVPYELLSRQLIADGQVLESAAAESSGGRGIAPTSLPGIVIDDAQASLTGSWTPSSASAKWIGSGYRHDGNHRAGACTARFETTLPRAGRYAVRLAYTPNKNRATNATVKVLHPGGSQTVTINQQQSPPIDGRFVSLGEFDFVTDQPAIVEISNYDADGYVVIDAVQWLPLSKSR